VLLSDDIEWNAAFHTFCRENGLDYVRTFRGRLGMTRRPAGEGRPGQEPRQAAGVR
jgi:hypothetical protein